MAQRLVRAKRKIKHAGIPYRVPPAHLLPERTQSVLAVLYLLFNGGYSDPTRPDLSAEAIRLARTLSSLMPDEPEALGLLALVLFQDSRRATRVDADGVVVALEDQDRSRWDRAEIAEAAELLERALRRDAVGPYQLQAAIAAAHALAPTAEVTDWPRIAALYGELLRWIPSPVVELNRAAAVAMADGPEAGLALLATLDLPGYHLLPAARADLLRRLGRSDEARVAYEEAAALAPTDAERRYLERRLVSL
jgi:RNA polymerase sigma-70 factor (ECF subfamily)